MSVKRAAPIQNLLPESLDPRKPAFRALLGDTLTTFAQALNGMIGQLGKAGQSVLNLSAVNLHPTVRPSWWHRDQRGLLWDRINDALSVWDGSELQEVALGGSTAGLFVGEIRLFAHQDAIPSGWFECNGQLIDPNVYPEYAAAAGTTHGGNGITTVGVPDLSDRVPAGRGAAAAGDAYGTATHTLATSEIPAHTHTGPSHTHSVPSLSVPALSIPALAVGTFPNASHDHNLRERTAAGGSGDALAPGTVVHDASTVGLYDVMDLTDVSGDMFTTASSTGTGSTGTGTSGAGGTGATGSTGGGGAHENRQPTRVLVFGLWPGVPV